MRPYAVTPAFEGAPANYRNPYASMVASAAGQMTAGVDGVILGRFGWVDPDTGQVSNVYGGAGQQLGFVMPRWGTWAALYCQDGTWVLREGLMVTLASRGDFWARFPGGCFAGQAVFANLLDGTAVTGVLGPEWSADSETVTADAIYYTADGGGFQLTQWTAVDFVAPNELGRITSWQPPFSS